MKASDRYERVVELAKRRGFFWPSNEIYGGVSGFITFGPLGSILKRNIEDRFRRFFLWRLGIFEIDTPLITPARVFEASSHVESFREPMLECQKCHRRFRADHLLRELGGISETEAEKLTLKEIEERISSLNIKCPECNGDLGEPKYFLTMFTTTIGPYEGDVGYGRPEAAQGVFTEFKRLQEYARGKLPFGVAQIGRALRNEISPRQGPIRLREFTIMDLEFFFDPEEPQCPLLEEVEDEILRIIPAETKRQGSYEITEVTVKGALKEGYVGNEWLAFFMAWGKRFMLDLGVPGEKQRFIEKLEWERAHYSSQGFDQEVYLERWGWVEVSGFNNRTDYDLGRHMKHSGVDMTIFKEYKEPRVEEKTVIEPVMATIGPDFKSDAAEISALLSSLDPKPLREAFESRGYYELGSYKILPKHVNIVKKRFESKGRRFIPHVIEPSYGSDRLVYVVLDYAYTEKENRVVLRLPIDVAPIQVGVYPLVDKDNLPEKAMEVFVTLRDEGFRVEYDDAGSIGRRYARADEIGTPIGITIDYKTLEDETVTLRNRDTWTQVRAAITSLPELLRDYFHGKKSFEELGEPFQ